MLSNSFLVRSLKGQLVLEKMTSVRSEMVSVMNFRAALSGARRTAAVEGDADEEMEGGNAELEEDEDDDEEEDDGDEAEEKGEDEESADEEEEAAC